MDLDKSIETTLTQIQKVMNTNSIVGTAITTNDKIIIPISRTALGFGIGSGTNSGNNELDIGGVGGGGSIDPIAFVIVYRSIPGPDGIEVLPVEGVDTPIEDFLNAVGKLAFEFLANTNKKAPKEKESNVENIKTKVKKNKEDK